MAKVTLLPVVEVPPVLVPAEELPVTCPSMAPARPTTTYISCRSHIVHDKSQPPPPPPGPAAHHRHRHWPKKEYSTAVQPSPQRKKKSRACPRARLSPVALLCPSAGHERPVITTPHQRVHDQSAPLPRPQRLKSPGPYPQTSPNLPAGRTDTMPRAPESPKRPIHARFRRLSIAAVAD